MLKEKIIKEYNNIVKLNGFYQEIENSIKNVTEQNLENIIEQMINTSTTLSSIINDNQIENPLASHIYSLAYQLIKLELIYTNNSTLLENILKSKVATNNVEKYLLEEIQTLDLSQPENQKIRKRYNELKSKGLNTNFLDYDLLNLLKFHQNEKYLADQEEDLLNKSTSLEQQQIKIKATIAKIKELESKIEQLTTIKKTKEKSSLTYMIFLTGYFTIFASTTIGFGYISKKIATLKYIPKYTITYDINKDKLTNQKNEEWISCPVDFFKDNRVLKQYNPWYDKETEENGYLSHNYYREILTYDLNSVYYDDIKDYANINLENYNPSISEEKSAHIAIEDLYQEPQYIITEIHYDKENIFPKLNKFLFGSILLTGVSLTLRVELLLLEKNLKRNISRLGNSVQNYKETITKKKKLEKELSVLKQTLSLLTINYKALQNEVAKKLKYLPESLSSNQERNKVRKRIKEKS